MNINSWETLMVKILFEYILLGRLRNWFNLDEAIKALAVYKPFESELVRLLGKWKD